MFCLHPAFTDIPQTAVALLSPPSTPPAARAEFKKLLIAHNVRKSIADGILARVLGGVSAPPTPAVGRQVRPESAESARVPTPASEDVDIVYVSSLHVRANIMIASARDLDNEFKTMIPLFSVRMRVWSVLTVRGRKQNTTGDRENRPLFAFEACCGGRCSPNSQMPS